MKKIFLALVLVMILFSGMAYGQSAMSAIASSNGVVNYFASESVTIDATAGGVILTAATSLTATTAFCTLETAEVRFVLESSRTVTSAIGHLLEPGQTIFLTSPSQIQNFHAIRTTAASAVIQCSYGK